MKRDHQLVGYDRISETPQFLFHVTIGDLYRVNFHFAKDDPEGLFTYRLDYSLVSDIVGIFHKTAPANLDYFIEPYP